MFSLCFYPNIVQIHATLSAKTSIKRHLSWKPTYKTL
jgi:hypothetical protein